MRQIKKRRGFTLTELSVAMAAGSTLMVMSVGMVHKSFNWTSTSKQRVGDDRSFDRLQRQFRLDVRIATDATMDDTDPAANMLSLTGTGGNDITYKIDDSGVQRIEKSSESSGLSDSTRREHYRLGESLLVQLKQIDAPKRFVLSAKRITPLKDIQPATWRHVEAVLGQMKKLERAEVAR